MERIPTSDQDFLENDQSIPGQSYCCISFLSPDEIVKNKELFIFQKYMSSRCLDLEKKLDETLKTLDEEVKNKVVTELKENIRTSLKYNYEQFKDELEAYKYRHHDNLEADFNKICNYKTNIRGVKVRGVYSTFEEAQVRARKLQSCDRSFNVYVGQVGFWLPWDPSSQEIQEEEYLETELNTLMKEYRANEVRKDMFYDERKREMMDDAIKERLEHEKNNKAMNEVDPWVESNLKQNEDDVEAPVNTENSSEVKSV